MAHRPSNGRASRCAPGESADRISAAMPQQCPTGCPKPTALPHRSHRSCQLFAGKGNHCCNVWLKTNGTKDLLGLALRLRVPLKQHPQGHRPQQILQSPRHGPSLRQNLTALYCHYVCVRDACQAPLVVLSTWLLEQCLTGCLALAVKPTKSRLQHDGR